MVPKWERTTLWVLSSRLGRQNKIYKKFFLIDIGIVKIFLKIILFYIILNQSNQIFVFFLKCRILVTVPFLQILAVWQFFISHRFELESWTCIEMQFFSTYLCIYRHDFKRLELLSCFSFRFLTTFIPWRHTISKTFDSLEYIPSPFSRMP